MCERHNYHVISSTPGKHVRKKIAELFLNSRSWGADPSDQSGEISYVLTGDLTHARCGLFKHLLLPLSLLIVVETLHEARSLPE